MSIQHLDGKQAIEFTKNNNVVIVNVTATWCGPCQMFAPILEEISNNTPVIKVDLDQNRDFAQDMGVRGVPTTFIYKNGKIADTVVGYMPKEVLETKLGSN